MKKISFLVLISAAIIFSSCKKEDSPSFVDDYNVDLTEEKGTEHTGDYFPLAEGYYWRYSVEQSVTGKMVITGGGYDETEPIDETENGYSEIYAGGIQSLELTTGTYQVYPLNEGYAYRYFEKNDDAIHFRAFTNGNGEIVEVKNSIFLKIPIVVGDSWETEPLIDALGMEEFDDMGFESSDAESTIKSKKYVIGKVSLSLNGEDVDPIRVDEVTEADAKMSFVEEGVSYNVELNNKMTNILYLLEDVGLVKQDLEMETKSTATINIEGQTITMKMDFNTEGEVTLDSYDLSGSAVKKSIKVTDIFGNELKVEGNPVLENAAKKVLKIANTLKKLSSF